MPLAELRFNCTNIINSNNPRRLILISRSTEYEYDCAIAMERLFDACQWSH